MTSTVAAIRWQRLDVPGHDVCRLLDARDGWVIEGHAVFQHDEGPADLVYWVMCDRGWHTRSATVRGSLGSRTTEIAIERTQAGDWLLNGGAQKSAFGQTDLDLGFTPATNTIPLRRFSLAVGQTVSAPAAYLPFPESRLIVLEQSYRRLDTRRYDYEAPVFGYHEVLEVGDDGFVARYPRLWEAS